jgi:hypothetical protein
VRFHVLTAALLEMQVLRNVTPCRLDVSKDRSALASMTTPSLATYGHKTPHTLSPRSAVFGTLRKSYVVVALVRPNSDTLRPNSDTVHLFPSYSDLSKDSVHVQDHRVRTATPTLQPTETSESHTSEGYTADRAANIAITHNLPQNERKWPRQVS